MKSTGERPVRSRAAALGSDRRARAIRLIFDRRLRAVEARPPLRRPGGNSSGFIDCGPTAQEKRTTGPRTRHPWPCRSATSAESPASSTTTSSPSATDGPAAQAPRRRHGGLCRGSGCAACAAGSACSMAGRPPLTSSRQRWHRPRCTCSSVPQRSQMLEGVRRPMRHRLGTASPPRSPGRRAASPPCSWDGSAASEGRSAHFTGTRSTRGAGSGDADRLTSGPCPTSTTPTGTRPAHRVG